MVRTTRWSIYCGLILVVALLIAAADGKLLLGQDNSPGQTPAQIDPPLLDAEAVVVGFGHVDVDGGTVPLSVPAIGPVDKVFVSDGQAVKAGDLLVQLRDVAASIDLARAEVSVRAAQVKLEQSKQAEHVHGLTIKQQDQAIHTLELALKNKRTEVKKLDELVVQGLQPKEKLEVAQVEQEQVESQLEAEKLKMEQLRAVDPGQNVQLADTALDEAQLQAELARENVALRTLRAPSDGLVLRVLVHAGEVLGANRSQPAIWFCPDRPRVVRCEFSQEYASRVRTGAAAKLYDDRLEGMVWTGTVQRTSDWFAPRRSLLDEPYELNDVRTMECIISLAPDQRPLRIGQRMRAVIVDSPASSAETASR